MSMTFENPANQIVDLTARKLRVPENCRRGRFRGLFLPPILTAVVGTIGIRGVVEGLAAAAPRVLRSTIAGVGGSGSTPKTVEEMPRDAVAF